MSDAKAPYTDEIPESFYPGWVCGIALFQCRICHAAVPKYGEVGEESPLVAHDRYHKDLELAADALERPRLPDELVERVRDALDDPYGPETAAMFKTEYLILRDILASIDGEKDE